MEVEEKEDEERMEDDDDDEEESSSSSSDEEEEEEDDDEPQKAYVPGKGPQLEQGEELVMDDQTYIIYHQASLGPPCLSFDIIEDDKNSDESSKFPLTIYGVAGTQAAKVGSNSLILFKMFNLHPIPRRNEDDDDDDDEEDDSGGDPEKTPKLKVASIKHPGAVNRVRYKTLGSATIAAAWSDNGSVGIWNLRNCLEKLETPNHGKEWFREKANPLFKFSGHLTEGFALDWCGETAPGVLATGDCKKNIHIWKPGEAGTWAVDQRPLRDHSASVEDIQWSPNEANVLASCSVDKSIKVWDCRAHPDKACMLTVKDSHESDVNVINWNLNEPFIVSGGDDGIVKIWDLRQLDKGIPVATFKHHTAPVTSVEWHRTDSTVLASSGADDQIALWDLAIEKDDVLKTEENEELKDLPPQLLFIHQGLSDIKEIHWHRQIPGLLVSTSHTGLDVFKTISV